MSKNSFQVAYKKLNEAQKKAVDTIEGPVMVIAGPGTGKTSILTLRIANILKQTDTPANGILALTFTESGVHSMRRKLVEYLGPQAYRVHIYTFHGFAQEIITRYPEYFPRIIGGVVVTDSGRYKILEEALLFGTYEMIRPFGNPTLYVRKALGAIQDLKRDGVSPKDFRTLLLKKEKEIHALPDLYHEKGRFKGSMKRQYLELLRNSEKSIELAKLYEDYEGALKKNGFYDYEDMLLELVYALKKHKELLRTLQEEYLYILADEHQDANNSQNAILELLSDYQDTQNLFIVGDEKQAIYRFQGASLENFLYFQKKYPSAVVIFLDENFRSTQMILDAAHSLMGPHSLGTNLRPRLTASSAKKFTEKQTRVIAFSTSEDEMEGIAKDIASAIRSGILPEEIAILVRTNAEIAPMGRALQGFALPYTLFTDDDVLSDSDIAKLLLLMRAILSPEKDELLGSALLIDFLGIHPIDAVKLNRTASEKRISPLELLFKKDTWPRLMNPKAVQNVADRFAVWMVQTENESALDAFVAIIADTQFQEHLLRKKESLEKVEKLAKLYDEVKSFLTAHKEAKLKDFVESLDTLMRHGGSISFARKSLGARGVAVMTAHKSKGLEWQRVYIVNIADKQWGNRRSIGGFKLPDPLGGGEETERNEDERRLFYVAMTRAKEEVTLSYARLDAHGKDRLITEFALEIPENFLLKSEGEEFLGGERLTRAKVERKSEHKTIFDREYLKEVFLEQGLNATALNNYIECPWKYFFKNLVRLPETPEPYLHYGNAVHAALKALGDAKREKKKFKEEDFLTVFEKDLERRPLSKRDLDAALKKGKKSLSVYFKAREATWHADAFTEYGIDGVHLPLGEGAILLRGRLDKLELLSGSQVNVVDYKTGGHKSRNEILGETKNSEGNIKRQLNFYRLLLELHDKGKYEMVSGTIDFVEPDEKGKLFREVFTMGVEDAEIVKKEIVESAQEISSFSFWDKECHDPKCEYCKLKQVLF